MMPKKKTFEQALSRLEEIIESIESGEITLDESVKLYKEGIDLSVFCGNALKKTEQEIVILKESADKVFKEEIFEYKSENEEYSQ